MSDGTSNDAGSALFLILKTGTKIKLDELTKVKQKLDSHYDALLKEVKQAPNEIQELAHLYQGVKDLQVVQEKVHQNLDDVGDLLDFAQLDSYGVDAAVKQQKEKILKEIRQRKSLWKHNATFGGLLMEFLEETEKETAMRNRKQGISGDDETYVDVEPDNTSALALSKEDTIKRLKTLFFQKSLDPIIEEDKVYRFLEEQIFQKKQDDSLETWNKRVKKLENIRNRISKFGEDFLKTKIKISEVAECIENLLKNKEMINQDSIALLQDAKSNVQIQDELAMILTIQLSNLKDFQWKETGIPVLLKRGMNGRFRCHLQEDALNLLLFEFIAMKWTDKLKTELKSLLLSLIPDNTKIPGKSIQHKRMEIMSKYTLTALKESKECSKYTGDEDDLKIEDKDDESPYTSTDKQGIMRLICTETHLLRAFQDPTCSKSNPRSIVGVTTDLEFFGPSISREAVMACLRFYGVPKGIRSIFLRYLEIPMLFPEETKPTKMLCGVPVSRSISMLVAEMLLFMMDFYVFSSSGIFLYRCHDDICFFDADEKKVLKAWECMQEYAKAVGLRFNEEKSGSVRIHVTGSFSKTYELGPTPLPQKAFRWGLLQLESDGTLAIQEDNVKIFASEMANRLQASKSILTWVNVYNKYMFFFLRNFGQASPAFGIDHVDRILNQIKKIHELVFPDTKGDVASALAKKIKQNHQKSTDSQNEVSIAAAWMYWPMELGGLGLYNPYLSAWSLKEALYEYQINVIEERDDPPHYKNKRDVKWEVPFFESFKYWQTNYHQFMEKYQKETAKNLINQSSTSELFAFLKSAKESDSSRKYGSDFEPDVKDVESHYSPRALQETLDLLPFIHSKFLEDLYTNLQNKVQDAEPESNSVAFTAGIQEMGKNPQLSAAYWKWVSLIYSPQILEEFSTVSFFNRELLPSQLIEVVKKKSVSW